MDAAVPAVHSRTKIACEECRKNKRKCDGQRPTCLLCDKSGKACVYAYDSSRKRKYVDEDLIVNLQNRISELESQLRQHNQGYEGCRATLNEHVGSQDADVNPSTTTWPTLHQEENEDDPNLNPVRERRLQGSERSQVAMEELASLMLTMDLDDKGEPSFTLPPGKKRANSAREITTKTQIAELAPKNSPHKAPELDLITRQQLIDYFMQRFNVFHKFLEETDVKELVEQYPYTEMSDTQFRNFALLAVGAHLSDLPTASELSSKLASSAEAMAFRCIREASSDLVCQGLALLAWRELIIGNDSMAYNYIAMATGVVHHLGLHVSEFSQASASSNAKPEIFARRVRSFWAYFSVDRLLTSSIGMNCTIHWQRVRASPFASILNGKPTVDDISHDNFCQLWHLWDSCMDQGHAFGWAKLSSLKRKALLIRSHQSLEDLHRRVNLQLRPQKGNMLVSAMWFQIAYQAAILLIHRPFLNEPTGSSTLNFALRSATTAAASISRMVREFRNHGDFNIIAPQIIDYILSAAVIHLLNATSGRSTLGRQSANGLRSCTEALLDMHPKWNIRVQRSITRIQELANKWKVVWALPISLSQPLAPENPEQHASLDIDTGNEPHDFVTMDLENQSRAAGFWSTDEYVGALDQIHASWGAGESWDLDILFQNDDQSFNFH